MGINDRRVTINDPVALLSTGPLIGQEYLSLRIKTPARTKTEIFDYSEDLFSITRVLDKTDLEGHQVYTLQITTHEALKNMRTKIRRTLVGTESEIVENLFLNDLAFALKKFQNDYLSIFVF